MIAFLPRIPIDNTQNLLKEEAMWATTRNNTKVELLKPFAAHILPWCELDVRHEAEKFHVYPTRFCYYFGQIPPSYSPNPLFWNVSVFPVPVTLLLPGIIQFFT
jgi:hypothetical protein